MKRSIITLFCFFIILTTSAQSKQDTIFWNPCYKLKWDDFKGELETNSEFDAISGIGIDYEIKNQAEGKITEVRVFCYFNKTKSLVKEKIDSLLLKHEQGHFDIAELFTRKLRKEFEKRFQNDIALTLDETESVYTILEQEYKAMDNLYDKETDYSRNDISQKQWTQKIAKELAELRDYSK